MIYTWPSFYVTIWEYRIIHDTSFEVVSIVHLFPDREVPMMANQPPRFDTAKQQQEQQLGSKSGSNSTKINNPKTPSDPKPLKIPGTRTDHIADL
jgi:hypothetical protein